MYHRLDERILNKEVQWLLTGGVLHHMPHLPLGALVQWHPHTPTHHLGTLNSVC
jgi:hypothetical protein